MSDRTFVLSSTAARELRRCRLSAVSLEQVPLIAAASRVNEVDGGFADAVTLSGVDLG
ncbi:hypothetical protein [Salinispora sp. H7-4]|uniref:hypothetical protein n=1 Tax=Salinispora sp. H7-4 TaxID=2748321 RepID=UPI0015D441F4|nr:hypothetical protein [Salinispora sp. H7-4]NYT96838.1 hypothetical protein [Salinispora sp. H7-4]